MSPGLCDWPASARPLLAIYYFGLWRPLLEANQLTVNAPQRSGSSADRQALTSHGFLTSSFNSRRLNQESSVRIKRSKPRLALVSHQHSVPQALHRQRFRLTLGCAWVVCAFHPQLVTRFRQHCFFLRLNDTLSSWIQIQFFSYTYICLALPLHLQRYFRSDGSAALQTFRVLQEEPFGSRGHLVRRSSICHFADTVLTGLQIHIRLCYHHVSVEKTDPHPRQRRLTSKCSAFAIGFYILDRIEPYHQHFSLDNKSLQYPYAVHERVTIQEALLISIVSPIVIIAVYTLLIDGLFSHHKPASDNTGRRKLTGPYRLKDRLWELNCGILGLLLSQGLAFVITQTLKNACGKPRPDLIDRCQPATGSQDLPVYGLSNSTICHGDPALIKDGFRSWPSGHSSCKS